ncbi:hypothetical protein Avbf_15675 [Armadillidium vulgare]|nr:hypothetical protein Avbf_15675 [Armadillidium vulgare]
MVNLKPENMSFFQWNLIKKYVHEWEAIIEDSTEDELNQLSDHPFPELEVPYRVLPTEIQNIYKLYHIVLQLENEIINSEHFTTYEDFETTSINMFTLSQFYLKAS